MGRSREQQAQDEAYRLAQTPVASALTTEQIQTALQREAAFIDAEGHLHAWNPATGQVERMRRGFLNDMTNETGPTAQYFFESDPAMSLSARMAEAQLFASEADKAHFAVGKTLTQMGLTAMIGGAAAYGAQAAGASQSWASVAKLAATTVAKSAFASANAPPPPPPQQEAPMNGFGDIDWGSQISGLLTTALNYRQQRAQAAAASGPLAMPGMQQMAFPSLPAIISGGSRALGLGVGAVGGAVVRGGRYIATAIGNISKKRVVAIAKQLGIQGAATALGLGAVEIAQMVLDEDKRKGRRGGITSAQMRTTRRTIGKVERLHRQIVAACSSARVPSSRRRSAKACPPPRVIVTKR